ncbi:Hsp70 family protein, partial [Mycobacterium celatum]
MADAERPAVGLSVGATNLAAVTASRAVTRKPVLTLYRQRPPEVGVPSENPKLTEPGLVITDFVDRVGDPVGIVASDGSTHRSETLLADALRALAYAATDGRALPEAVAATHPAHWGQAAVGALHAALSRVPEWSGDKVALLPDSTAALTALQSNPGLPTRGIIALCDFGGTGTSLTLVDAAGYHPVAPTVRHTDFSGDLIDQALLAHVMADLSSAGSVDTSATSAIGSLTRLRGACRRAKEELSSTTATTLTAELPGYRGEVRVTRTELDEAIRQPLAGFIAVVQEALQRNGVRDLAAVASMGGGAGIPVVTTTLSERLRVPVITTPRPHMTAAIGAALQAARGPADNSATALAPAATQAGPFVEATTMAEIAPEPSPEPALAWSEADDDAAIMPLRTGEYPAATSGTTSARPQLTFDHDEQAVDTRTPAEPWYRRPAVVVTGTALVVLAIIAAV